MTKVTSRKSGWQASIWQTFLAGAIVAAVAVGGSSSALAASGSWRGTTNASWATTGNWSGASPPTTSELATFNGAGNGNTTIDLGTGATVRSLVFDSANAAAYTIGSGAVGSQTLTLNVAGWNQEQGGITVNSTVANNQLFNANVLLGDASAYGHYITNSSTAATLTLAGNVSGGTGGSAGAKTLYLGGAGNTVISGTIGRGGATSLALNKTGAGTLTLSGSNTYNGATTLNQGTINLDFSAATAPAANILSSSGGALAFTGGTLRLTGKASTANSQAVASTTVGSGNSSLVLNANSATSLLLNLNAISRSAGGTLDLSLPAGTQNSTNGVITSSTANLANSVLVSAASNGIAYATVGGSDWATISGSNIVAMTTYQTAYSANNNVNVANGDTPASGITVNTLRFNGNNTLNLSGTNTVNTGGVLVTNAATTGATISGGTLISGGGRELVLINNGAQLTVGSVIANNGANAAALTLSGTGTTVLNGVNTYTGATTISNGTLKAGSSQALGVNSNVTLGNSASAVLDLNGNNLTIGALNATGVLIQPVSPTGYLTFELSAASVALGSNTLTVGAGNAGSTFGGSITGVGGSLVKIGTGGLVLNGSNSFTGGITIRAGSVTANGYLNGGATYGSGGANTLGTGTITLGDASGGSDAATLNVGGLANSTMTYTNALVLAGTNALTLRTPNSNTTIFFNGNVTGTNSLTVSSAGGAFYVSGNLNNSGNLSFNGVDVIGVIGSNVQNVTIVNGRGGQTVQMNSINNTGTFTHSNALGAKTTLGSIGSNVTAFINSAGTLELGGPSAFAGNTLLNGGTLVLMDNLSLQNSGIDTSGVGVINATSRPQPTFGGLIGSKDIASVITTGYSSVTALTLNPQSGRSYTYSGIIGNGVAGMTLTKSGSGTQVLSGSNTYTGATTVTAGLLAAGSDALSGQNGAFGNATSAILVGNTAASSTGTAGLLASAAVTIGRNVTVQSLGASGAQTAILGGSLTSGTAAFTGNITLSRAVTLQAATGGTVDFSTGTWTTNNNGISVGTTGNDGTVRIANALGGSGGLTLNNGNLVLTASNAFSGVTTLNAGTLAFDRVTALNSSSGVSVAAGSILDYTGTTAGTLSRNVTVSSSGTGTIRNSGGQKLTLSGTLTKDGRVLRLTGGTFDVTGQIVGSSANSDLLVDGTSTVTLLSANTYNGPTFVNQASTLVVGINNVIPNNSVVTLGNATTRGTLDLGSNSDAIGGLVFSGSGGTVRMAANQTASPQLSTASSLTLGSNASLDLAGMQTSAGRYQLISYTSNSGTFGSVTGLANGYQLVYGATQLDAQQQAVLGAVTVTNPASAIITGGSANFTYTVANSALSGGASLSFTGAGASNVAGSSSGSAGAASTSTSVSGLYFNGASTGQGQTGTFTVSAPNAYGSTSTTGTVSVDVYDHAAGSATGTTIALADSIVGYTGSLSGLTSATISNASGYRVNLMTTGGTSAGFVNINNVSGIASGSSGLISAAAALNGTQTVGNNSLGNVFNLTYADDSNLLGASNNLGSQAITVTGRVLDHATPGFLASGITDAYAQDVLNINFGSIDESAGTQSFTYNLLNLASQTYGAGLTAALAFTGVTADGNGFASGLSTFGNLIGGGTSSLFTLTFAPTGQGTFSKSFTLSFSDNQSLAGYAARRDLTINAQVIVVPEPGAIALAGIGIAAAAYALRSRSPSRKRAG